MTGRETSTPIRRSHNWTFAKQGRTVVFLVALVGIAGGLLRAAGPQAAGGAAPAGASAKPEGTLLQVMRGVLYPASNVIFAAQSDNPADVPPAKDPATATDPLASTYGKWTAVENSGLAIAEAANLLTIPGRKCSNGVPVPIRERGLG